MDLSKALDTLTYQILIKKLEYYGLYGLSIKLMENYLFNRKHYAEINESNSEILSFTNVVPQGSILGPLLFIIYINDIAHTSKMFNFIIYADNINLSTSIEIVFRNAGDLSISDTLNNELILVNKLLKLNKLSLNVNKSKYMIFHTKKKIFKV